MKLLRDFIRLRTAGPRVARLHQNAPHRPLTITVPQPLDGKTAHGVIDMHWRTDASGGRPIAQWHQHVAGQASDHLQRITLSPDAEDGPWSALQTI